MEISVAKNILTILNRGKVEKINIAEIDNIGWNDSQELCIINVRDEQNNGRHILSFSSITSPVFADYATFKAWIIANLVVKYLYSDLEGAPDVEIISTGFERNLDATVVTAQLLADFVDALRSENMLSDETALDAVKTPATGDFVLTGAISLADEVVIGTETYTFVETASSAFEVTVGASDSESFYNLSLEIIASSTLVTAALDDVTITVTSIVEGSAIDYATTTTSAGITPSDTNMGGGTTIFNLIDPNCYLVIEEDSIIALPILTHPKSFDIRVNMDAVGGHALQIGNDGETIYYEGGVLYVPTQDPSAIDKITLYGNGSRWELVKKVMDLQTAGA